MYRISFYKLLTNSYGMPFNVCQRSIDIAAARNIDDAVAAAKILFEQCENVPQWFLHADSVKAEAIAVPARHAHARRSPGPRRSHARPRA